VSRPTEKKRTLSPQAQIAALVAGLLLVAVLGFFLAVRPKRAEASRLDGELAAVQAQIVDKRAKAQAPVPEAVQAADLFRLEKAMPDDPDMAGVLLELNRVAQETGIKFESISPGGFEAKEAYRLLPIALTFNGDFFALTDFLFRVRNLVRVEDGAFRSAGRLFSVKRLEFSSGETFPRLSALLTVDAFVYGIGEGSTPAPAPPPTTTDGTATTEGPAAPAPAEPGAPPAPADAAAGSGGGS
jgi:hypothetical protein